MVDTKQLITAAGDKMPGYTYATTLKANILLQVVPIELLSKEGRSVSTYALLDIESEDTSHVFDWSRVQPSITHCIAKEATTLFIYAFIFTKGVHISHSWLMQNATFCQ